MKVDSGGCGFVGEGEVGVVGVDDYVESMVSVCTLQLSSVGSERNGGNLTRYVLPIRKEWIHSRALSWMPALWSLLIRVRWETVSKAAERSSYMRAAVLPWSRRE